jgi:hypothetical protein
MMCPGGTDPLYFCTSDSLIAAKYVISRHVQSRRQRQETIRELSVCIADLFGADRTPFRIAADCRRRAFGCGVLQSKGFEPIIIYPIWGNVHPQCFA